MSTLKRLSSGHQYNELGVSFLEATLVVPIFLILAFGLLDFGMIYTKRMLISQAFYKATRVAAMNPEDAGAGEAAYNAAAADSGHQLPSAVITTQEDGQNVLTAATFQIPCITCSLVLGSNHDTISYSARSSYPKQILHNYNKPPSNSEAKESGTAGCGDDENGEN